MEQESHADLNVLSSIISSLINLNKDDQKRTLQAVATFLDIPLQGQSFAVNTAHTTSGISSFSEDRSITPKDFIRDKDPRSDVEKVACLAYYLTHYKDLPHFKTLDISTLNTEAAQPKFSNASVAVDHAARGGLIVHAANGNRQISASGERYVQLLPDRAAARASMQGARPKRKPYKNPIKKHESKQDEK